MTILDQIIAHKRQEVAQDRAQLPLTELAARARALPDRPAGRFSRALRREDGRMALIAELKKASPSKGLIRAEFDPSALALGYRAGGADALSVLTDRRWFQGADQYLVQAREASGLPVLRKDFLCDPYQLYQARLLEADCVLLIVAALERRTLEELLALAAELGLETLVEVHDEAELAVAAAVGARLIGVNNRDLHSFETSLAVSERLAPLFPEGSLRVSESGISSRDDVLRLRNLGYHAVLVGEHLMRRPDLTAAVRELMGSGGR